MTDQTLLIRSIHPPELDLILQWAAEEGWNPGLHDAPCFYQADPQGFFLALLDNEPIGSISAVRYGDSFGFIGLYIVKPAYRGQGYGMQLWQKAISYLGSVHNIGLDGVVAQQKNYQKSGFHLAYGNIRYQGQGDCWPMRPMRRFLLMCLNQIKTRSQWYSNTTVPLSSTPPVCTLTSRLILSKKADKENQQA